MLLFLLTYFPSLIRRFTYYFKIGILILLGIFLQEDKSVLQRREAVAALDFFVCNVTTASGNCGCEANCISSYLRKAA